LLHFVVAIFHHVYALESFTFSFSFFCDRPPKFIPRSSLKDIIFGRGSSAGQSSNRYVDMAVILKEDESNRNPEKLNNKVEEFTNILGQEQRALQEYKEHFLTPYLKKESQEKDDMDTDDEDDAKAEEVEDDSEDDDDSFVEGGGEHDEESDDDDDDSDTGIQVVNDEFAEELARKRKGEDSVTESEDDASSTSALARKKRYSKRLRRPC
jgi:hypothetical protein